MGASWVRQEILQKHRSAKLAVYAVWLPMQIGDARSEWDRRVLDDPRVVNLWDEERASGLYFANPSTLGLRYPGRVLWDAYLLFGPEARWDRVPSGLRGAGATLIGNSDRLESELKPLLGA